MFCNECGQTLPDGSRFCNKCGANIGVNKVSIDAPVAEASYAEEEKLFTVRPTMIFVWLRYVLGALVVIATAALMGILHSSFQNVSGWVPFLVIVGVALLAFANPVYQHILRRRAVYSLTSHQLEVRMGILTKTVRNIPLTKIQDVTVTASFGHRLLKLGHIEIDSASETGKIFWYDIPHPDRYANMILAELRRRN